MMTIGLTVYIGVMIALVIALVIGVIWNPRHKSPDQLWDELS